MNEAKHDLKKKVQMKNILKGKKMVEDVEGNDEEDNFNIDNYKKNLNEGELISGVMIGDS